MEILESNNNRFIIRADKNSAGDALEMANNFFRTGLFEYVEPDLFASYVN